MAGLVAARGPGHRGTPFATLSLGIAERGCTAALRPAAPRPGNPAGARRGASHGLLAGARHPWDGGAAVKLRPLGPAPLAGITACLASALAAHWGSLPAWVFST